MTRLYWFKLVVAAVGVLGMITPGYSAEILFIGGQAEATQGDDAFVLDHLLGQGHDVTYIQASQSSEADGEDVDLIILSSTPGSGDMRGKFNELPTPILNWEEALVRWDHGNPDGNFRLSEDSGGGLQSDVVNIVNPDHCLAAGFPEGELVIADEFDDKPDLGLELAEGLIVIAEVEPAIADEEHKIAIAAIETGGILGPDAGGDELPSPGPRVNFPIRDTGFRVLNDDGLALFDAAVEWLIRGGKCDDGQVTPHLQAGDADRDLDFDQLDLVKVQIAAKYLTGQAATWGEGDWDGAPGGDQDNPPAGNGFFDQIDIISALGPNHYLMGPYAAITPGGTEGDEQTSLVYDPKSGELSVDSPASKDLTSINITSAGSKFIGDKPAVLDGAFDNFAADNIFKATFGGSFGDISFGNVLAAGLGEAEVAADLSAVGSLEGGGDLGNVDLVYVPEPTSLVLLLLGVLSFVRLTTRR